MTLELGTTWELRCVSEPATDDASEAPVNVSATVLPPHQLTFIERVVPSPCRRMGRCVARGVSQRAEPGRRERAENRAREGARCAAASVPAATHRPIRRLPRIAPSGDYHASPHPATTTHRPIRRLPRIAHPATTTHRPTQMTTRSYSIDLRKNASIRPCSGMMRNSENPQDFACAIPRLSPICTKKVNVFTPLLRAMFCTSAIN